MLRYLTDETPARTEFISEPEVDAIVEAIELKAVNRMLVAACWAALELRGIWTAINNPLMLEGERNNLRIRFRQIELSIRAAIEKADEK